MNKDNKEDEIKSKPFTVDQNDSNESDVTFVENTEEGEDFITKDKIKKIREDLKICRKDKEEYLVGWQRAKADYVNLQKELEQVRVNSGDLAKENLALNLLPVLDSFEMAFADKEHWGKINKDWQNGINSIYQQFLKGLSLSGIDRIDEVGVPFNPIIHESVNTITTNDREKDHTIEKIFQTGYKIKERVIRPAKVIIYEYKN